MISWIILNIKTSIHQRHFIRANIHIKVWIKVLEIEFFFQEKIHIPNYKEFQCINNKRQITQQNISQKMTKNFCAQYY